MSHRLVLETKTKTDKTYSGWFGIINWVENVN